MTEYEIRDLSLSLCLSLFLVVIKPNSILTVGYSVSPVVWRSSCSTLTLFSLVSQTVMLTRLIHIHYTNEME